MPLPPTRQLPLPPSRDPHRRRRDEAHRAVLQATVDLLDDPQVGWSGLTMEAVARRAQVSKATLYRWWRTKAQLVLDAYRAKSSRDVPVPDTGSVSDDLVEHLGSIAYAFQHLNSARTVAQILVVANQDAHFRALHRATLLQERRDAIQLIIERGRRRGQVRSDVDYDASVDALLGALHHRLLVTGAPIDGPWVRALVETVVLGLAPRPRGAGRPG